MVTNSSVSAASSGGRPKRDEFIPKESNCIMPKCMQVQEAFKEEYIVRQELLFSIEEALIALQLEEENLKPYTERYEAIERRQDELHLKLVELGESKEKIWPVFLETKDTRRELEGQIAKLKIELEEASAKARGEEVKKMKDTRRESTDIVFDHSKKEGMKHNGVVELNEEGIPTWSCCRATDKAISGCIEDHSVGERSALHITRNYFSNQISMEHPLQHGSLLFNDTNRELANGGGYLSKRSMWTTADEIHAQNHSSSQYFSMYKPKTLLEHVPPHFHQVRTTGLGFGSSTNRHIVQHNHSHKQRHHHHHHHAHHKQDKHDSRNHHHHHKHNQYHQHHEERREPTLQEKQHVQAYMHSISHKLAQTKQKIYLKEHYLQGHPNAASGTVRPQSSRARSSSSGHHPHQQQSLAQGSHALGQGSSIARPHSAVVGGRAFSQSHISDFNSPSYSCDAAEDDYNGPANWTLVPQQSQQQSQQLQLQQQQEQRLSMRRPTAHEIRFVSGGRTVVGRPRAAPERECLVGNRPMTAPDGYGLYDSSQLYL